MKFRLRTAAPRVAAPRVPRMPQARPRVGRMHPARVRGASRTLASRYREWRKRRQQRPRGDRIYNFSLGLSPGPGGQQQEQERERKRSLRERVREYRQRRAERSRHGWKPPVRQPESYTRMMAACRDVEAHRTPPTRARNVRPGHTRAPRLNVPRMPVQAPRGPAPRFRAGR